MMLRNFLFLDTVTMENYLATLEGSVVEGPIVQKEAGHKKKGLKGGVNHIAKVEGSYASETAAEISQTRIVNDAAKFQRLYELLEREHLQYLDAFDEGIWSQLKRGELLEVQARIRIPELLQLFQSAESLAPILNIVKALGKSQTIDSETESMLHAAGEFGKFLGAKPVPLVFEAPSTPGYQFVADLPRQFLHCELSDLQGEAIVLGKILRVLPEGKEREVFSLIPTPIASLDKAGYVKLKSDLETQKAIENVKGPAIIMAPLAVYR
jgi:hypothetical protein